MSFDLKRRRDAWLNSILSAHSAGLLSWDETDLFCDRLFDDEKFVLKLKQFYS